MTYFKCTPEMHHRCSNNALCHLCDGQRLFKDPVAERREKMRQREERKKEKAKSLLKTHQAEKKEGMAFEKKVAKLWNEKFSGKKQKPTAKPRIEVPNEKEVSLSCPTPESTSQPTYQKEEARRQFNSGAFWHSKGDIKLEHALMECKERGTVNSKGEKQITIQKRWLEKQEKEAFLEQRDFWYIPFGFKGDDEIYLIKPYHHEMEIIYELRQARQCIEELEEELRSLKEKQRD